MFDEVHPQYAVPLSTLSESVQHVSIEDLKRFWSEKLGMQDLVVCLVGDVSEVDAAQVVSLVTEGLPQLEVGPESLVWKPSVSVQSAHIEVADRVNVDVRLGHSVNLLRTDPNYVPLSLGVFLLGGNFSSHLMGTIRDRDGLTYGIRSSLNGMDKDTWGAWTTSVTLSQGSLERGIEATKAEIKLFLEQHTTEAALETAKSTQIGSYQINLSTTGGLASTLRSNYENGYDVERIDTFTSIIRAVSAKEVDQILSHHLHVDQLHLVSSGSKEATKS